MSGLPIAELAGGVRFGVRIQPRASRNAVVGLHGGALKIQLTAPPVNGRANEALVAFLAGRLGVARSAVRIASGAASRNKVIEITGISSGAVKSLAEQR